MTIINAFEEMLNSISIKKNHEFDFELLCEAYFPSNIHCSQITPSRDLENYYNNIISHESCRKVIKDFKIAIRKARKGGFENQKLEAFNLELQDIYNKIAELGYFVSMKSLANSFGITRSLAGIIELGSMLGITTNTQIISVKENGYFVPSNFPTKHLMLGISSARKATNYLGSVFPYKRLHEMPKWSFIPLQHRERFAKELLSNEDGYLDLANGDFFGFSNLKRDRILSRLVKIFSIYEEVPNENLTGSLFRTLKKRLSGKTNILGSIEKDINLLEECSEVFDEYCLKIGYCDAIKGDYRIAGQKLRILIQKAPPKETMYKKEIMLANAIKKHGKPMNTKAFAELIKRVGANKSHVMEFADLIYRTGYKRNSNYHTLDDKYEQSTIYNQIIVQRADRFRVEINRIYRNIKLSSRVKLLCKNKCQICGESIQIGDDEYYSEAHHIQPLGEPYNGPDVLENMLCVCPNHHVMLDYGVIYLDINKLRYLDLNPISRIYIDYHNNNIYKIEE